MRSKDKARVKSGQVGEIEAYHIQAYCCKIAINENFDDFRVPGWPFKRPKAID